MVRAQWRAVDFVRRVLLAGIGLLVDRHQPHQAHQAHQVPHTSCQRHASSVTTATFVTLPLHVPRHLA